MLATRSTVIATLSKVIVIGGQLFSGTLIGLLSYRVMSDPGNHWGFNILWLNSIFVLLLVMNFTLPWTTRLRRRAAVGIYSLMAIGMIIAMYHFNVLLPYEVWLDRGMPDRPF
uniref:hypothetical protein n=1 Tax=Thaumasiovibrio occultus TaxID=1891184 RepID=UPI000B35EC0C|nr:hypothetical protein [Thaumasiovibrio occultus]